MTGYQRAGSTRISVATDRGPVWDKVACTRGTINPINHEVGSGAAYNSSKLRLAADATKCRRWGDDRATRVPLNYS